MEINEKEKSNDAILKETLILGTKKCPVETKVYDNGQWSMRTLTKDDEHWFCLPDLAKALDATNISHLRDLIDEPERGLRKVYAPDSNNHVQLTTFVSEPAMYQVLNRSNLPIAKQFSKWVCYEVLPTIRKTGAYMTRETLAELEKNPRRMAELYNQLADMEEARQKAEQERANLEKANKALEGEKEVLKKKVKKNEAVINLINAAIDKGDAMELDDFIKLIYSRKYSTRGRNKTYAYLREKKWLTKDNKPTQNIINKGILMSKHDQKIFTNDETGEETIRKHIKTYISVKGMQAYAHLLSDEIPVSVELF